MPAPAIKNVTPVSWQYIYRHEPWRIVIQKMGQAGNGHPTYAQVYIWDGIPKVPVVLQHRSI